MMGDYFSDNWSLEVSINLLGEKEPSGADETTCDSPLTNRKCRKYSIEC